MRGESAQPSSRLLPLQPGIVYGPVASRRLGRSLGINLLPTQFKVCSFNCIYCQYGWTSKPTLAPVPPLLNKLPHPREVFDALQSELEALRNRGGMIDCLTFSGNGEPTLHPDLAEIIKGVNRLRDESYPTAKVAILSNSTTVNRKEVRDALELVDLRVMKLDAGTKEIIQRINHPALPFDIEAIIGGLTRLSEFTLQSLFVQGRVTNADPGSVASWIERVKKLRPSLVQIYSLDRAAPDRKIRRVDPIKLHWIASQVRREVNVEAEVY